VQSILQLSCTFLNCQVQAVRYKRSIGRRSATGCNTAAVASMHAVIYLLD